MALIKCSECGREISDKAPACVHCGCPTSVSVQNTVPTSAPNANPDLSVNYNAVLSGAVDGRSQQKVYVKELGRNVEFPIRNNTQVGDTIRVSLKDGGAYSHIVFKAVSVSGAQQAPAASASSQSKDIDPLEFLREKTGLNDPNIPTINVEARLKGPQNAITHASVFMPEFNKTVRFPIPNSTKVGSTITISADLNAGLNGINKPFKVYVAKISHIDAPVQTPPAQNTVAQHSPVAAGANIDVQQKIKDFKRRVYIKPVIRLFFSLYFILSFAGIYLMMYLYPNGGAPQFLWNITGIGFTFGFLSLFYFTFFPYIIGWVPDPGFFKTRKILKHLENRNLLEKAVIEMETCELVPFGDKMVLSNNFLFPKKKNGIILPCDELLWVYGSFSSIKRSGHLTLGTAKWGIMCITHVKSCVGGVKKCQPIINAAIQALQRRNPSIMVGETRENTKLYFQLTKKK